MKENEVTLCTVQEILGTTVFVTLSDGRKGTIITSEIAPGRIKNIREYVVPNKKIVCKILRIKGDNIELSLRRVSSKEKKEILQQYKLEQQAKAIFNQILKQDSEEILKKIHEKFASIQEFLEKAKQDSGLIEQYIPKPFQEQMLKIIQKKRKQIQVLKIIKLKCLQSDGIKRIKKIFEIKNSDLKITYISAGYFQLSLKAEDYKLANKKIEQIVENLEKSAKENQCEIEIIEKNRNNYFNSKNQSAIANQK